MKKKKGTYGPEYPQRTAERSSSKGAVVKRVAG